MPYKAIIQDATERLTAALKYAPIGVQTYVCTIPTTPKRNGAIVISHNVPQGGAVIRPNDNNASSHTRWETVPYNAIFLTLYDACRREPILPIHEEKPQ